MRIVLLGPPGAGKGTQAELLSQACGLPHVSTGDMFRRALAEGTRLGLEARAFMERGELVPDRVVTEMVVERLDQQDCCKGFILDGYPRTPNQARDLDAFLSRRHKTLDFAVDMRVPFEELIKRLAGRRVCKGCGMNYHVEYNPPPDDGRCAHCGAEIYHRADDQEETVRTRLEVYRAQTSSLIEYYQDKGILRAVSGLGDVQTVNSRLMKAVQRVCPSQTGVRD